MSAFDKLFEPLTFKKGIQLKNRLVMSPMTTWSSNDDYTISDEEVEYYQKRVNGVGLVITGCSRVTANGIGFTNEYAGYDDQFLPSLKKLATAAKSGGAPAIMQIYHAGNKAVPALIPDGEVVSASAVTTEASPMAAAITPRELTPDEILDIIKAFGETARRAIEAGFDGVEIHGAHGFLIQNFMSPSFNQRADDWGGSLDNRLRFGIEVVKEVKRVVAQYATKPFLLGYRISPEEMPQETYGLPDTFVLIDKLIDENIDYLHFSLLNAVSQKTLQSEDTDKVISAVLADYVNERTPVITAGGINTPQDATRVLENGVSMVALARTLVVNPNWVELVENNQSEEITPVLRLSTVHDKRIPAKLMNIFDALKGFIPMEA